MFLHFRTSAQKAPDHGKPGSSAQSGRDAGFDAKTGLAGASRTAMLMVSM
jgi:hypothetical protein